MNAQHRTAVQFEEHPHWPNGRYAIVCSCGAPLGAEPTAGMAGVIAAEHRRGRSARDLPDVLIDLAGLDRGELRVLGLALLGLRDQWRDEHPRLAQWAQWFVLGPVKEEIGAQAAAADNAEADLAGGHVLVRTIDLTDEEGGWVSACTCGWDSPPMPSGADADHAAEEHIEAFWASVPEGMQVRGGWCTTWCSEPIDRTCRRCQRVRYIGPDCEHVAAVVDADGICMDCRDPRGNQGGQP